MTGAPPPGAPGPSIRHLTAGEAAALAHGREGAPAGLREELRANFARGPGAVVLRGLDASALGEAAFAAIVANIGRWLGVASIQSPAGECIARVEAVPGEAQARGTHSDSELRAHTDLHDILALGCCRPAVAGGESFLISAPALYQAIRREAPQHLPALHEGYYWGTNPVLRSPRRVSTRKVPVFFPAAAGRGVQCAWNGYFMRQAALTRGEEVPPALADALAVLTLVAERMAQEARFMARAGDIVFWHNWSWLHGRTAFVDSAAQRRLLFRLWLRSELPPRADPLLAERANFIDRDHALTRQEGMAMP